MRSLNLAVAACALALAACKKDAPAPPSGVGPVEVPTSSLHAVRCGTVTAEWLGAAPDKGTPKAYGASGLVFNFPNGTTKAFSPSGELDFSDWSFEVFSPDCARVALLQDHHGPYHLVKVDALEAYLAGGAPEAVVLKKGEAEAMVHSDFAWLGPDRFELFASCCGGVEVFQATTAAPGDLKRKHFAAQAPNGLRRLPGGGWETNP